MDRLEQLLTKDLTPFFLFRGEAIPFILHVRILGKWLLIAKEHCNAYDRSLFKASKHNCHIAHQLNV